jgi:hypothetical protein
MRLARFWLITAALTLAYYGLAYVVLSNLPYLSVPHWTWPSRLLGVLAWFEFLTIVGALVAALPVAFVVAISIADRKVRAALVIGAITALAIFTFGGSYESPTDGPPHPWAVWASYATLYLSLVFAVPLLVRLMIGLPSNNRWRGP